MVNADDISKYIVNLCYVENNSISNLKLQKVMYMLQVDFYKKFKEKLIDEDFEAWPYGPVIPKVYYNFCQYGGMNIENKYEIELNIENNKKKYINEIINKYSIVRPWELVNQTHKKGGAWDKIYQNGIGYKDIIPFELIIND